MIKEILGIVEKNNSRYFLISALAISLLTNIKMHKILSNPLSWHLLVLPIYIFISYILVFLFNALIINLNSKLNDNDIFNWGTLIGCNLLALALIFSISYLGNQKDGLTFSVLLNPNFMRIITIFLLAVEATRIKR